MGYDTRFSGCVHTDRPMSMELADYINAFTDTRHVKRDVEKIKKTCPDWEEHSFNGALGSEGEYFVTIRHDDNPESIIIDSPPESVPGTWCGWIVPDDDLSAIVWDGEEHFYDYDEWLQYIIDNFIAPSGYTVNGMMSFYGDDEDDHGLLVVHNNKVSTVLEYELLDHFDEVSKVLSDCGLIA